MGRKRTKSFIARVIKPDTTGRAAVVRAMAERAKDTMRARYDLWRKLYEYRQGVQWPTKYKDRAVHNFIYCHYYHAKALLTEVIPEPEYEERTTGQKGKAVVLGQWWDSIREGSRYRWRFAESVGNAWTYGTGWFRPRWDPTLNWPFGNLRIDAWSPWTVHIEPEAKYQDGLMWTAFESDVSRRRLEAQYGPMDDETWQACRAGTENKTRPIRTYGLGKAKSAVQYEMFLQDGTLEEKDLHEKGASAPFGRVPRYLKVVGDCVLHDGISLYGEAMPLVRLVTDPIEDEIYGRSRIEQLLGPQDTINRRNHALSGQMDGQAFGMLWIDREAAVDQKIKAKPGGVYFKSAAGDVKWLAGPGGNPMEAALVDAGIGLMDRLSMTQQATQGVRPSGITSGVAINALQTAAMAGIRMQVRQVGEAVQDLATRLPGYLQKFYRVKRPVAMEGIRLMLDGRILEGDWMVKVDTKAMLPSDTLTDYEMLTRIVQMTGMSPEILIDKAPRLSDVDKARMKEKLRMMYQAAAQAEAQGEGSPQGAPVAAAG